MARPKAKSKPAVKAKSKPTTTPKKRAPTRYHHGDLRSALIKQALRVIARRGVDAVKMSDLAKSLRVSSGAPFRHFSSRQSLLVAVAEEGTARMIEAISRAALNESDPVEQARARGVAYVRFAVSEPAIFRLLSRPDIVASSTVLGEMAAAQHAALEVTLGRHHRGDVAIALAKRSAGLLAAQSLTHGLAHLIVDGLIGVVTPDDAEALAYELTGVLGDGLFVTMASADSNGTAIEKS